MPLALECGVMKGNGMTNPQSVALLKQTYGESPIASGIARIKSRDSLILDEYQAVVGMKNVAKGGINFLESDWIVTAHAFYYITPRAMHLDRFLWPEIKSIRLATQRLAKATVEIGLIGNLETMRLETTRSSATLLIGLWNRLAI